VQKQHADHEDEGKNRTKKMRGIKEGKAEEEEKEKNCIDGARDGRRGRIETDDENADTNENIQTMIL